MFWQSFICGIGGSMGVCIVFTAFALLFGLTKSSERKEILENSKQSLEALQRRNDLTEEQHKALWRIVEALERTP